MNALLLMARAAELEPVAPGIVLWRAYDPSIKTELFSTALSAPSGTFLIDPIPLPPAEASRLNVGTGIVITTEIHERAATAYADQCLVPVYSAASKSFPVGLTIIPIEGA